MIEQLQEMKKFEVSLWMALKGKNEKWNISMKIRVN